MPWAFLCPKEKIASVCFRKQNRLLSQQENVDLVNRIFGAHVLKDAFVNLRISDEADAAAVSDVASVLAALKNRPNMFVDAW